MNQVKSTSHNHTYNILSGDVGNSADEFIDCLDFIVGSSDQGSSRVCDHFAASFAELVFRSGHLDAVQVNHSNNQSCNGFKRKEKLINQVLPIDTELPVCLARHGHVCNFTSVTSRIDSTKCDFASFLSSGVSLLITDIISLLITTMLMLQMSPANHHDYYYLLSQKEKTGS